MRVRKPAVLMILCAVLLAAELVATAEGLEREFGAALSRSVVAAEGLHATGGDFELNSTAGQAVAGFVAGAEADLLSGFWDAHPLGLRAYLPLYLR